MVTLGLVVSRYHRHLTDEMDAQAHERASERGATVEAVVRVPGVFDTPLAADRLARRDDIDAVAVLGVIIEGETSHDQVIGHAVASSLHDIALERDTPVTLGIAGPGMDPETAANRTGYGQDAVEAAIELVDELDA